MANVQGPMTDACPAYEWARLLSDQSGGRQGKRYPRPEELYCSNFWSGAALTIEPSGVGVHVDSPQAVGESYLAWYYFGIGITE